MSVRRTPDLGFRHTRDIGPDHTREFDVRHRRDVGAFGHAYFAGSSITQARFDDTMIHARFHAWKATGHEIDPAEYPTPISTYVPMLDFSDARNSQYVGVI